MSVPGRRLRVGLGSKWAMVPCSHPLLSHRHVARPSEWRHDRHHFHFGFPTLLPDRGLCWSHHPQLCVSTASWEGGAWGQGDTLSRKDAAARSSETGQMSLCSRDRCDTISSRRVMLPLFPRSTIQQGLQKHWLVKIMSSKAV